MTVYSKTNAGRLLAFDQKPGVELMLRDLLKRVDGKTPYQQLINTPEEAELLKQLEQRQLIKIAPEQWRNSSNFSGFSDTASSTSMSETVPAELQDETDNITYASPPKSPPPAAQPRKSRSNPKIMAVKALMASFIEAQLPEHADATEAEINALNSEAQLLSMLTGYINLVNPTGKVGQLHVQELLLTLAGDE